ncbi:MAG: MlaE family ABC transporter permease [Oligoflexales bacterium]
MFDFPKPILAWVGYAINQIELSGRFIFYIREIFQQMFRRPFRQKILFQQIDFIGNQSAAIILLTGFATGAVFGLQIGGVFTVFNAEGMIGGATGIALATELAPLMTGFLLTGRAGSAMTAEIAIMKVNEQVDAMEAMGVHPVHYLVVPRVLASMIIMPFLCGIFMFIGIVGVYIVGVFVFNVDEGVFYGKLINLVKPSDIMTGLRKMLIFSFVIAAVSCKTGLSATKGAEGVGLATTNAVVRTLILILLSDFVISYIEVRWLS